MTRSNTTCGEPTINMGSVADWEMFGLELPPQVKVMAAGDSNITLVLKASTAVKLVDKVLERWGVSMKMRPKLLGITADEYKRCQKAGYPNSPEALKRVEDLHAIHRALTIIFSEPALHRHWFMSRNTAFNDSSPYDVALKSGTTAVRWYLEGWLYS